MNPYQNITEAIETFANGEPMHFIEPLGDGIWFEFDCPFEDDLIEPLIPISVGINAWSPHFRGEPEERDLMDYGRRGDQISAGIQGAVRRVGMNDSDVYLEYSPNNSNLDAAIFFMGAIDNPRVRYSAKMEGGSGEMVVKEKYA